MQREPGPKERSMSPLPLLATAAPGSGPEVSESEKRLFVHIIDHLALSQEND